MAGRPRFYTLTGRFTLLVACAMMLSMAVLGVVIYRNFSDMVDQKVEQLSENLLMLIGRNLDYMVSDVQDTANMIVTSSAVQDSLRAKEEDLHSYAHAQALSDMQDLFSNMVNNKQYISAVYAGNANDNLFIRKGRMFRLSVGMFDFNNPPEWLNLVRANEGAGIWFHGSTMLKFADSLLVYARQIRDLYRLKEIGLLLIGLDTSAFDDLFNDVSENNHMGITIYDRDQMIYRYDKSGSERLSRALGEQPDWLSKQSGFVDIGGESCYVQSIDNSVAGWHITCAIPYHDFAREKNFIVRLIVSLSVVLWVLVVLGAYLITKRSITGTLGQLHRFVESFRGQDGGGEFAFGRSDEVGVIGDEFVKVVKENERLMINLYKSLYKEKEAELIALQAQIDPHFLYNTLDTIFWAAQEYGADDIARMTVALSNMFRLSLNSGHAQCPLESELALVNNYLTIQNMRYNNRFTIQSEIPENLMKVQIIKLILQPVVENAVRHGLEKKQGAGSILISAQANGDDLALTVADDGVGFNVDPAEPLGHGYALHNVDERIKLYYGDGYGVEIRSEPDRGTIVRLNIRTSVPDQPEGA